jgi:polar amino acid transport system permease protein
MVARVTAALAFAYGAFEAETLRGGLTSLPRGQAEAARALGLSRAQSLRHVLLPQTFRRVLPTLGNDLICLLKDSALVSVLGVRDITQEARLYQSATFRYTESLVLLAFFYIALTLLVALAVRALENRYRRHAA